MTWVAMIKPTKFGYFSGYDGDGYLLSRIETATRFDSCEEAVKTIVTPTLFYRLKEVKE